MMTPIRLRFLQSLLIDMSRRSVSAAAAYFADNFAIGARIGRGYEYTPGDLELAKNMLLALGLPLQAVLTDSTDRADAAARPGLSEKSGTIRPHADEVAFQIIGQGAQLACKSVPQTLVGYQVAKADEIRALRCDAAMVVENFETFQQIRRYQWVLRQIEADESLLVVFRGDPTYRVDAAARVLGSLDTPIWGFFDFDPAGLFMCSEQPRLTRLVLPPLDMVEKEARKGRRGDLFHNQVPVFGPYLDACIQPQIAQAWALLKRIRLGLPQEWMRDLS
jgi:hypothetical protein